jgi:hypothetical protein
MALEGTVGSKIFWNPNDYPLQGISPSQGSATGLVSKLSAVLSQGGGHHGKTILVTQAHNNHNAYHKKINL